MSTAPFESYQSGDSSLQPNTTDTTSLLSDLDYDELQRTLSQETQRVHEAGSAYIPELVLVGDGEAPTSQYFHGGLSDRVRLSPLETEEAVALEPDIRLDPVESDGAVRLESAFSLDPLETAGAVALEPDIRLDPVETDGAVALEPDIRLDPLETAGSALSRVVANTWDQGPSAPASSELRSDDVKALFERNFSHLDTDGNGFVSEWEIDVSFESPYFTGADAQLLAVLKQHQDQLEELSNDE